MNAIKLFSLGLLSVICITFSSCVDDTDYIVPQSGFKEPDVKVTTTIKALKALYKGRVVDFKEDNLVIEGYVVSSDEGGNIYKAIYIQDKPENPTAAIQLSVDAVGTYSSYDVGRKVYVKLNGLGLSDYNGTLQIGELKGTEVERISSTSYKNKILRSTKKEKIVPLKLEISKITDEHIGMLIEFEDMHSSVKGHTYAELNNSYGSTRIFKNCKGEKIGMRTSGFAKFKGHSIPDKKGSLISILTKYSKNYQLIIRDTDDVKFTEEIDCSKSGSKVVLELNEDFSSTTNYEDIDVIGWEVIATKGKRKWGGKESGGDLSAGISGFKYNGTVESWLITPGLDIANTANKTFSFDSQTALSMGETLEVLISTDYAGDPAGANWTILSGVTLAPKNTAGSSAVINSGIIDLSSYSGVVHIAFKYSGNGTDKTGTYLIDNVKFGIDIGVSTSFSLDKSSITLNVNASEDVIITGNSSYTVTSSAIGTVTATENNGVITIEAKATGNATIEVTDTANNDKKSFSVTVNTIGVVTSNLLFSGSDFENWTAFEADSSLSSYGVQSTAGKTGNALHLNKKPTSSNPFVFKAITPANFDISGKTKITFYVKGTSPSKSLSFNLYKLSDETKYYKFNVKNLSTTDVIISPSGGNSYTGIIDTNNTWVKVTFDITGLTDIQTTVGKNLLGLKIGKDSNYDLLIDDITIE